MNTGKVDGMWRQEEKGGVLGSQWGLSGWPAAKFGGGKPAREETRGWQGEGGGVVILCGSGVYQWSGLRQFESGLRSRGCNLGGCDESPLPKQRMQDLLWGKFLRILNEYV